MTILPTKFFALKRNRNVNFGKNLLVKNNILKYRIEYFWLDRRRLLHGCSFDPIKISNSKPIKFVMKKLELPRIHAER